MKKILFVAFLSLLGMVNVQAQAGWEVGGWAGMSHYFGDLNTDYDLSKPGIAAGAVARYNFNTRLALKFNASYGNVRATDADSENAFELARNLHFRSVVFDGTAQFEFNFLPYVHGSTDEWYTPYLFAGASVFYFNPKAEYQDEWIELRPLGTEGQFKGEEYYTVQGGLAYGGGFKFSLSYRWSIDIEISSRVLFSDYLDDVSTVYADPDDLEAFRGPVAVALADRSAELLDREPIGQAGRQRGDSSFNDSYTFVTVGVNYYFGNIKCPPLSR
ncbi:MAG: DUF6089 family protein [Bacteroidota bacterium]